MSIKFLAGFACMTMAVLCCAGVYIWVEADSYWWAAFCAGGALSWVYHAMRCVE
jgi:hypothetical protein